MSNVTEMRKPYRVGFLLVPNFSMIAFASAIETMRMANRLSDKPLYEWHTIGENDETVAASNGITVTPDCTIAQHPGFDAVFVCSGVFVERSYNKSHLHWLRKIAQHKVVVGALCTGTWLLAKADLLDGYRCTIHWENMASLREEFPAIVVTSELFEIDRNRYTCAGGTAALDLFLNMVMQQHDKTLAANISEQFICDRIRGEHDRQRVGPDESLGKQADGAP